MTNLTYTWWLDWPTRCLCQLYCCTYFDRLTPVWLDWPGLFLCQCRLDWPACCFCQCWGLPQSGVRREQRHCCRWNKPFLHSTYANKYVYIYALFICICMHIYLAKLSRPDHLAHWVKINNKKRAISFWYFDYNIVRSIHL